MIVAFFFFFFLLAYVFMRKHQLNIQDIHCRIELVSEIHKHLSVIRRMRNQVRLIQVLIAGEKL